MNRKMIMIVSVFLILSLLNGCSRGQLIVLNQTIEDDQSHQTIVDNESTQPVQDSATLLVTVIDSRTQEPVTDAAVYLGIGGKLCITDAKGQCPLIDFVYGDYALSTYKRGYERFSEAKHFDRGEQSITIRLEKQASPAETIIVQGTVAKIVTAEGSKSENHYFILQMEGTKKEYLFDYTGENQGFGEYVDKEVKVQGYRGKGFIGWQHEEVEGIYIESISAGTARLTWRNASAIKTEEECISNGGKWHTWSFWKGGEKACDMKYPDAGKACHDSSDCESQQCLYTDANPVVNSTATGECALWTSTSYTNHYYYVEDGRIIEKMWVE